MFYNLINLISSGDFPRKGLEFKKLGVYLVNDLNLSVLSELESFGIKIFGEAGMDRWGLVPHIRHGSVFVLKERIDSEVIGLAVFMRDWTDEKKSYLYDYAIETRYQGKGLGYLFLKSICYYMVDLGYTHMELMVATDNKPALALYQRKLGFEVKSVNNDEYGEGQHRYAMSLDLVKVRRTDLQGIKQVSASDD